MSLGPGKHEFESVFSGYDTRLMLDGRILANAYNITISHVVSASGKLDHLAAVLRLFRDERHYRDHACPPVTGRSSQGVHSNPVLRSCDVADNEPSSTVTLGAHSASLQHSQRPANKICEVYMRRCDYGTDHDV